MRSDDVIEQMDAYLEQSLLPADPVLDRIAEASAAAGLVPHAVTPLQAAFLAMLIRTSGARRVLEIGCLGGYSAVAMAQALPDDGYVLTTEIDTRTADIAATNIETAGFADRIEIETVPAKLDRIPFVGAVKETPAELVAYVRCAAAESVFVAEGYEPTPDDAERVRKWLVC